VVERSGESCLGLLLASQEATIHPRYRERLLRATADDTVFLEELFDVGWPKAPHRVLRNKTVETWEAAGRPPSGARPGEGEVIARSGSEDYGYRKHDEIVRYQCYTPGTDGEGDIDALSLWAGQSVGLVSEIKPARDIVREIVA
jgi:NAD(P)H-dependent flavin oxidoreductase YrpB (nitropropane dioxygenase family)